MIKSIVTREKCKVTSKKGITLIALVVTIIVLLILAGISIQMLTGQNGILKRAEEAKIKTDLAKEKEFLDFSVTSAFTPESLYSEFTLDSLQTSLNSYFGNNEATAVENPDGSFTIKIKESGNEYQLTKTGQEINVNKVKDEHPAFLSGTGSEEDPFLIESIEDLVFFSYQVREGIENYEGKYVELATDLNFSSSNSYVDPNCEDYSKYGYTGKIKEEIDKNGFIPIGQLGRKNETSYQKYFKGTFDGKKHSIINLSISKNLELEEDVNGDIGFFTINFGTIKNLNLISNSSINLKTSNQFAAVGFLCGVVGMKDVGDGFIEDCKVGGNLTANIIGYAFNVGGLVGALNGEIKGCINSTNITIESNLSGALRVGGVCGAMDINSVVENCYNTGKLAIGTNVSGYVGGITGIIGQTANSIKNVYNIGKIEETSTSSSRGLNIGGVVGFKDGSSSCVVEKTYSLDGLITTHNSNSLITDTGYEKKTNKELSGQAGVTLLNTGNDNPIWVEDTNNINNGYPILKWQV